jgi:hypothetical protein|tara:strand:+ start:951 stop:1370 length:420 start_codon:yes stop_codon:yes gene_type:complete
MNTYIWKHEKENGEVALYAGKTRFTAERRINTVAAFKDKYRTLKAKDVKIIHEEHHECDKREDRHNYKCDVSCAEDILINTLWIIRKLYPEKVHVLNTNAGLRTNACCWEWRRYENYKDKNSEGLDFFPQLLSKIIKEL